MLLSAKESAMLGLHFKINGASANIQIKVRVSSLLRNILYGRLSGFMFDSLENWSKDLLSVMVKTH